MSRSISSLSGLSRAACSGFCGSVIRERVSRPAEQVCDEPALLVAYLIHVRATTSVSAGSPPRTRLPLGSSGESPAQWVKAVSAEDRSGDLSAGIGLASRDRLRSLRASHQLEITSACSLLTIDMRGETFHALGRLATHSQCRGGDPRR